MENEKNENECAALVEEKKLKSDPAGKFKELATYRVNAACKRIQSLGTLANPRLYAYTPEQINEIFSVLQQQLELAKRRFDAKEKTTEFIHL